MILFNFVLKTVANMLYTYDESNHYTSHFYLITEFDDNTEEKAYGHSLFV